MGWTFQNDYGLTTKDFIVNEFSEDNDRGKWWITDVSVRGNVVYCIQHCLNKNTNMTHGEGMVILISRKDGQIGYKDMGESCGPYYTDAPKKLLDKLDTLYPTKSEFALKWRASCRAKHEKKAVKVKAGAMVKFAKPLRFMGLGALDTFYYEPDAGTTAFKTPHGFKVRIPKWKEREHTVVSN